MELREFGLVRGDFQVKVAYPEGWTSATPVSNRVSVNIQDLIFKYCVSGVTHYLDFDRNGCFQDLVVSDITY